MEIINKISELREDLYKLIDERGSFADDEVIKVSAELDKVLNQYNKKLEWKNESIRVWFYARLFLYVYIIILLEIIILIHYILCDAVTVGALKALIEYEK